MRKRGQYYLRLVSRLCIAFVMIFSIMLCNCVNEVHALVHKNTIYYDEKSWTSPLVSYSLDGSCVTGTWNGGISYNFTPQFEQNKGYLMHITINPKVTQYDPKSLLETNVNYYVIMGGQKYYFDANNSVIFRIPEEENGVSLYFTVGFDINYAVEPYSSSGVTAYMSATVKLSCQALIYEIEDNDNVSDIISNLQYGNQLQQQGNQLQEQNNQLQQQQNETTNNIFTSISNFFGSFFDNLIGIFVPESGYFENYFQRLNNFFAEKLGMLYAPIDMFISLLTAIKDSSGSESGIQFPGLKWEDTYIIEPQSISISTIAKDFPGLQEKIYFATDVIMVGAVVWLLQVKLKEVLTT